MKLLHESVKKNHESAAHTFQKQATKKFCWIKKSKNTGKMTNSRISKTTRNVIKITKGLEVLNMMTLRSALRT